MPLYKYTVRDKTGKVTSGSIEADSERMLRERLDGMGYIILTIGEESKLSINSLNRIKFGTGVKSKDVAIFARQFSTMITAGLSLTKCLSILGSQAENQGLKDIITEIQRDVEGGQSLSEAMVKHSKVFPPLFISMVRAGETGGVLDEVLSRVADHLENELTLKGKIKSAMTYPIAMFGLIVGIAAAMMLFVVPVFQKMFAEMGAELPMLTQIMIGISDFLRSWAGAAVAGVVAVVIFAFKKWIQTESGRYIWDGVKLRMPVVGGIVGKLALARFTRTFSTLVAAGVPILNALDIVADTAGNAVIAKAVRHSRAAIKDGEPVNKPLSESKVFPPMLVQMVAVGEETGALDSILSKVADFYDEEVSASVDSIMSLIEPFMMATMGGVVGMMVLALYMPMFSMITAIQDMG